VSLTAGVLQAGLAGAVSGAPIALFVVCIEGFGVSKISRIWVAVILMCASGCASLPDVNRMQNNMDQMTMYMGMMVQSTGAMAATAQRMEQKSNNLMGGLEKKGSSAERAIQNYSQALLDNQRGVIKNLQGIRDELSTGKTGLQPTSAAGGSVDQAKLNSMQNKIDDLEKRLATINAKMKGLESGKP
jgi:hypothetical protein